MSRPVVLQVRLSRREMEALDRASGGGGRSEWARGVLLAALGRMVGEEVAEVFEESASVGVVEEEESPVWKGVITIGVEEPRQELEAVLPSEVVFVEEEGPCRTCKNYGLSQCGRACRNRRR